MEGKPEKPVVEPRRFALLYAISGIGHAIGGLANLVAKLLGP